MSKKNIRSDNWSVILRKFAHIIAHQTV